MPNPHSSGFPADFKSDRLDSLGVDGLARLDYESLPLDCPISFENLAVFAGLSRATIQKWASKGTYGPTGEHIVLHSATGYRGRRNGRYTTRRWVDDFLSKSRFSRTIQNKIDIAGKGTFRTPGHFVGLSKSKLPRPEDTKLADRPAIYPHEIASAYGITLELVMKWITEGRGKFQKIRLKAIEIPGGYLTCQDWVDEFFAKHGGPLGPIRKPFIPIPKSS